MYNSIFHQLGLTSEQSQIYLSLLENGPQTASQLTRSTKVKRTYIYTVVKSLVTLGLALQETKDKIASFKAVSPDILLGLVETKKQQINQAYMSLNSVLPELSAKYVLSGSKPIITYHEGIEGIKSIYQDTLEVGQPIYSFLQNAHIDPDLRLWLKENYLPQRIKRNIHAQVVIASGDLSQTYIQDSKSKNRTAIEVPAEHFPFKHEVNIYGPKVAFMNFQPQHMLGFTINHPDIATTMRAWFELTWQTLSSATPTPSPIQ